MMELSHSLLLNDEVLKQISESKRPIFVFEWLRFLDKILVAAQKSDIKGCQKKLVEQLTNQINESPGPPTAKLISRCLATLFSVGDTFLLFDTISKCNDLLKNKDDSPSYLPTRLAAIAAIGAMYERLGRMMGRSYEESVQILLKTLKNAESQVRCEIMVAFGKICCGMGTAANSVHKDIYKAARQCMTDRVMSVRCTAAKCIQEMIPHAPFLSTVELENVASLCFRSFDSSSYDVRCSVGKLLGTLMGFTQQTSKFQISRSRSFSLDEILTIMSNGFLKGGIGFLKSGAGDMIKGTSGVSREIRVGVTHAYLIFIQTMGGLWLERNVSTILVHVLELLSNPKASTSHVDAVYSRKCINFILRSVFGRMLGEKAQVALCKELCVIIAKHMNNLDVNSEFSSSRESGQDIYINQHVLVCALQELGILESVVSVLIHPMPASRLAAAWCLRCICIALPYQLTPLIDKCMNQLDTLKSSPEAIAGYSAALAALVGCAHLCPLGIPHARGKMLFNVAEDLLRSASQNSRLSLHRTQAGWLIIGSIMTLGPSVVRGLLPRMMLLWRNSFPRSSKELESEKARGDAFTWQVTLESRAGALSAMHSFLAHCNELVTDDVVRRLLTPIECALTMLSNISGVIKSYGQHLKAGSAMVRLRLYETLCYLPPQSVEGNYSILLRLLVAEFTMTENPANTTTSLLRAMCHSNDSVILGSWLQETDHKAIEDQLQTNSASGSGALEHDPASLYRILPVSEVVPVPLPLGVVVIDMSVKLFGLIFPRVANKHRYQMLEHFGECIKQTKAARQEAVQINIFTAVLSSLKSLAETKTSFGQDDVRKAAINLVMGALTHANPILRCAAGEALGRMAQVVGDSRFVAEMAQNSFDKLKSARDVISRTGHSLALGCVHRYVGGMGSGQYLNTSVSILLALAQDTTSPTVQVWALHALALIADSGGPMFRTYVEPALSLAIKLLLQVPPTNIEVHQCIGKCLSALITAIGPELQGNTNSVCAARSSFLCACAIMQDHSSPLIQAEATACLQQLHIRTLSSSHLLLRRAAVACLRQLAQREAREVCEHAMTLARDSVTKDGCVEGLVVTETGLPGVLFGMLDVEIDGKLVSDLHDTLTSMLQSLAEDNLSQWINLCKDVLTSLAESTSEKDKELEAADNEGELGDEERFKAGEEVVTHPAVSPRWPTRVFAAESVERIINVCEGNSLHFDLTRAKEMQLSAKNNDYLVLHLSDLIRVAFIAATSDSDQLRLEGLKLLQMVIDKFAKVPEPEFPGHVILEQFQAQVGAALRPAFSPETPPHVTAVACHVCSTWIGSGVARDLNDLRRVHQLLVSSLTKLKRGSQAAQLYNESAATLEKLAILKAWAEVYIVAMSPEEQYESLLDLVKPELIALSKHWLAALKDHALLSLPPEFLSQLPYDGGAFYSADTIELARRYYRSSWPPILHAAALWLNSGGFENVSNEKIGMDVIGSSNLGLGAVNAASSNPEEINADRFHLVFGICMEALCSPRSSEPIECVITCLRALGKILNLSSARANIGKEPELAIELCNVLHRLLLSRESTTVHLLVLDLVQMVVKSAQEESTEPALAVALLGEGSESGEIVPGKSVVFAILEVCMCVLVRQFPKINTAENSNSYSTHLQNRGFISPEDCNQLIVYTMNVLSELPNLCSPTGSVAILPTLLILSTGVLKEVASRCDVSFTRTINSPLAACLHTLRSLATSQFIKDHRCSHEWKKLLQSALAKILDLSKSGTDNGKPDEVAMLLAVAVFVLGAPVEVVCIPNLQFPCINLFQQTFQSDNLAIRLKCVQTLKSVFLHSNCMISTPYIHALAPRIIEYLLSNEALQTSDEQHATITLECLQAVETLISVAEPNHKIHLLSLAIPLLIRFLVTNETLSSDRKLHIHALQCLMKIGPQYPGEFRTIMARNPDLRARLESAIRSSQNTNSNNRCASDENDQESAPSTYSQFPSIKLKTDFSNFTG
uniref:HEAT repeat-containing protein 5A n=1 Tax=Strigamia maritima TaxID=126957 RepID=T1IQK7_STRMM